MWCISHVVLVITIHAIVCTTVEKLEVDLTQEMSSQLQSGFIQAQAYSGPPPFARVFPWFRVIYLVQ